MITIHICAGSSCHVRGTYQVIDVFKRLIDEHSLHHAVVLKGRFCLGRCTDGVNMEIVDGSDEEYAFTGIKPENAAEFFLREIVGRLNGERVE